MTEDKPARCYTNGEVNVEWRPERCVHCQNCIDSLPEVFDLNKRPWVNMQGASTDRIREAVSQCPSQALKLVELSKPGE